MRNRCGWLLIVLCAVAMAKAEDQDLRARAVHLLDRARLASRMEKPTNIRTTVTFSATGKDGLAETGSYTRNRSSTGELREDVVLGEFKSSHIQKGRDVAYFGAWMDLPYAVESVMRFIPYAPLRFDPTDVIGSIDGKTVDGRAASCIEFVTVRGEDRNPGEICVANADGTVLAWHDRDSSWQAAGYTSVNGALEPSGFAYKEGAALALAAQVKYTMLDTEPTAELTAPANWNHGAYCRSYTMPIAKFSPQPRALGGLNAPVIDVEVHAHVSAEGSVTHAEVEKPVRADLDAEAVQLVSTWRYSPGTCEGQVQDFPVNVMVHFQGR